MDRVKEIHGYQEESKRLYLLTNQANLVDSWSILKLAVLTNYVDIYTSIIKSHVDQTYYLETNAGSGLNSIEDIDNVIIFGSPMVAYTKPKKKFDGYILIEKNPAYCEAVRKLIPDAVVINGDANKNIKQNKNVNYRVLDYALDKIPKNTPFLAFVDPYGMDIQWETLKLLLGRWSDVIINFQSVARTVGSTSYNPKYNDTLTNFFGTTDWQSCKDSDDYLQLYIRQINRYKDYAIPIKIQGAGNYHYHLIVAVKKTKGTQKWIDANNSLKVRQNELVRLYVVNMGTALVYPFHIHGTIFKEYPSGLISNTPEDHQTVLIGPGDATIIEGKWQYPGSFLFHAHGLEVERGGMGCFYVIPTTNFTGETGSDHVCSWQSSSSSPNIKASPALTPVTNKSISMIDWQYQLQKNLQKPVPLTAAEVNENAATMSSMEMHTSDLNKNLRSASTIDIPVGAATPKNGQYYAPENAQLSANSKVTWINKDNIPHTSTADDNSFDTDLINP
jgi:three-Cys-motif partner protein